MSSPKPTITTATEEEIRNAILVVRKAQGPRKCILCDKVFMPRTKGHKFCSAKCSGAWHRMKRVLEDNQEALLRKDFETE